MRTQEERLIKLHERANEMQERRAKNMTSALGASCIGLFVLVVTCMTWITGSMHSAFEATLQGSSLLSESAGGYVLTAVLAFFAGVIVTIAIIRHRKRNVSDKEETP